MLTVETVAWLQSAALRVEVLQQSAEHSTTVRGVCTWCSSVDTNRTNRERLKSEASSRIGAPLLLVTPPSSASGD